MSDQPTMPSIASLTDWSVGLDELRRPTVTMHLNKEEARAWAVWLLAESERQSQEPPK